MTRDLKYNLPAQTLNYHWLACVENRVHTCINADIYITFENLCVFRTKETDNNEKRNSK